MSMLLIGTVVGSLVTSIIWICTAWYVGGKFDTGGEYIDTYYKIQQWIDTSTTKGPSVHWNDCLYKGKPCKFQNYWSTARAMHEYEPNKDYRIVRVIEQVVNQE